MSKVPKLRFPGFSGEWRTLKMKDFAEKINKKNRDYSVTNVISNSARNGLVSQKDYFDKDIANENNLDGYYIISTGDFVYNPRKSLECPYGPVNRYEYEENGIVSPLYLCFRVNKVVNSNFLSQFFKTSNWHRFIYINSDQGARHDRVSIKDSEFFDLDIAIPSLCEQQKIASFFSLIDEKIQKNKRKLKLYKITKKE